MRAKRGILQCIVAVVPGVPVAAMEYPAGGSGGRQWDALRRLSNQLNLGCFTA